MQEKVKGDDIRKNRNVKILLIAFLAFILVITLVGAYLLPTQEQTYQPEWRAVDFRLANYTVANLSDKPVLVCYYSYATSTQQDEMESHIQTLKDGYSSDMVFIEITLDDNPPGSEIYQSYIDFDVLGEGESMSRPPMFTVLTRAVHEDSANTTFYITLYGSSPDGGMTQKAALNLKITEAIGIYNGTLPEPE